MNPQQAAKSIPPKPSFRIPKESIFGFLAMVLVFVAFWGYKTYVNPFPGLEVRSLKGQLQLYAGSIYTSTIGATYVAVTPITANALAKNPAQGQTLKVIGNPVAGKSAVWLPVCREADYEACTQGAKAPSYALMSDVTRVDGQGWPETPLIKLAPETELKAIARLEEERKNWALVMTIFYALLAAGVATAIAVLLYKLRQKRLAQRQLEHQQQYAATKARRKRIAEFVKQGKIS